MIVTFNYAEQGVMDPRPILLFLHQDNKTKNIEGLNFRIQISNPKKRSAMSTKRFYNDIISADKFFKEAYRAYKIGKLTSLKVTQINIQFIK